MQYLDFPVVRDAGACCLACSTGSSGPSSSPGRGHCVMFLGKTCYYYSVSLFRCVVMDLDDLRVMRGVFFKCRWHLRRVPFDQKFRFQFPKFSYVEWNGIFHQAWPISFYSRLAHFPPRITQENAGGSWWSGCLKCRIKLLHVEKFNTHSEFNSSLIFIWEKLTNFSRRRICRLGELTDRKFGIASP